MQFTFTGEQQAFAESVRRFARAKLEKDALARARSAFPLRRGAADERAGLMGITLAEADGGQGGTLMDAIIAIEQVAAACPRSADVVQFGNFGPIRTFAEYGTAQQKARWLPDLLQGRMVMSLGISEPDAGSAATELKTGAKPDGAHYVVNGSKLFSTFSGDAAIFLVYVRCPGVGGIGSVIVERDTPGFSSAGVALHEAARNGASSTEDCRIPAENAARSAGSSRQMAGFNVERTVTPRSLAFGRYAFNQARENASTRKQFGRPLCEFQGLQWKFADMAIKLESAQLLLYRAAANADRGLPSAYETAIAKSACNLAGFEVASEAGADAPGAMGCMPGRHWWMVAWRCRLG
jgi:alkylation response protein AidB-like acyl-CoA dehydrogenase